MRYGDLNKTMLEHYQACAVGLKIFHISLALEVYYWYLVWRCNEMHENIFLLPQKLIGFGLKALILLYCITSAFIIFPGTFSAVIGRNLLRQLPGTTLGGSSMFFLANEKPD